MLGMMSVTVLDAACTSMYRLFSLTGHGCWYAVYGVQDDTERRLRRIDAEALVRTVRSFLENETTKDDARHHGGLTQARRLVESTLGEVEQMLGEVREKQRQHGESWFAYWSASGCEPLLDELALLAETLNKRFALLLEIMRTLCLETPPPS